MNRPRVRPQFDRFKRVRQYAPDYARYETLKAQWRDEHPHSTQAEYDVAIREIAMKCGI